MARKSKPQMRKRLADEVYPNSPLAEVVFEVRFPGELRVETQRHLFWELIRNEYPLIRVPHPKLDQATALLPYRFDRHDKEMTVMVSLNSLALSATKYPGFAEFKKEIVKVFSCFDKVFKIKNLNRAGWRYVNVIPFVRENGLIPLDQFLAIGFKLPKSIPEKFGNISLAFNAESEGGNITTRLETCKREGAGQEALLLDFDYGKDAKTTKLLFSKFENYIDDAHLCTRRLFEDMITDNYRAYLRGEVL